YLTQEYSLEGASLTNPSMVLAPDQSGLRPGESRILLSLRSIGEGHISSIQFRSGRVDAAGGVEIDRPGPHPRIASHRPATFLKAIFREKLIELHVYGEIAATVLDALGDEFTMDELNVEIDKANGGEQRASEAS